MALIPRSLLRRRSRERRWRMNGERGRPQGAPRSLVVGLVLASLAMMALDRGPDSAIEPARQAVGGVIGPLESGTSAVVRPLVAVPGWVRSQQSLRDRVATLEAQNGRLQSQLETSGLDRNRLAEYDALTASARKLGYTLVPAHVVAVGPSQSFSDTVTIDAGASAGLRPDQTVVNNDGLVGRVLRVGRSTSTVLLVVDPESTIGGRVGSSMQIGFLHGRGGISGADRLDLDLVDAAAVPRRDDTVVTWGSQGGAPYVAGVPVGRVTSVYSSLRESSQRAVIEPFVDFGALDLVGVVVPSGTASDRQLVEATGEQR